MAASGRHERGRGRGLAREWLRTVTALMLVGAGGVVSAQSAAADGPTSFSNTASIAIPASGSANQMGSASPYPSSIDVSGMAGSVTAVTVTFNNLTHSAVNDIDAMVVAPTGANLVVLSDIGDPTSSLAFASNATLTFSDSAAGPVPTGSIPTGTYKPTNNGAGDTFPSPAPAPSSQTSLGGAFTGINPNGSWRLFAVDDTSGDIGVMSGGWSLTITTEVAAVATTTTVTTSGTPSRTGDPVTFTATVTAGGSPVTAGTVQFADGSTALGSPVTLNASGVASLTTSALAEGTHEVRATYSGATGFLTSNGSVTQRVDNATVVDGNTFCNNGALTVPSQGASVPYPSNITVSGLAGQVTKVTTTLKGLTHSVPVDLDVMLSGAQPATNVTVLSDSGGTTAVSGLNVTFDDAAATAVPSPLVAGTFRPTDNDTDGPDTFPAPAPSPSSATTLSTFDGSNPNGTWSLWVVDDASGDSGSISGGWCVTVTTIRPSTTTLTSSVNPSTVGQSVTFTSTVASGGSPVTSGTVQFSDGGTALGSPVPVAADGTAKFTTSALAVGTHTIRSAYSGTGFEDSSDSLDQVVNRAATATTVTSSLNPSTFGDSVTFTATVTSGGSPVTTGTVDFTDGATTLATGVVVAPDGTATFTTSALGVGTHTITATYAGTATLAASTGSVDQAVNVVATATGVTSSLNPSTFGDSVTFTATVTSGGSPVTTGTVDFTDGATTLATGVVVAPDGTATFTTSALGVGTHTITASYSGTATLAASSGSVVQAVNAVGTATSLTSSLNPSTFGDTVTFTATVTSTAPVTTGTVQLSDGGTALGSPVPVAADGTATFTTAALAVGTHTITAAYSGTATLASSTGSVDQVVTQVTTATTLTSSPNPSSSGQAVTFTATVTGGGGPVTTGTVDISEGGTTLATGLALAADGTATFTTAALAVGTHTITATYSGTASFAASAGSVDQVVSLAASTTSVTSSLNPSSTGDAVTFTATVTSSAPVTTGTVQFSDDGAPLGSPQAVAADGSASVTTAELAAGNHTITAAYSGTATFGASTGSVDQTVNLVADAGGPYTVAEGDSLTLDGTGSSAADSYSWDLNGDGDFTDATGPTPTLTWSALEALGIDDGPSTHAVSLRVTGGTSTTTSAAGALTVTNTGPTAVITDSLTATVGQPFTIKVGADDPSSADMAATFTYTVDWGDGSPVVTVDGPADPPVTHTYSTVGSVSATFAVTDKDGGTSGPTTVTVTVQPASNGGPPQQSDEGTSSPVDEGSLAHTGADGTNDLSVLGTVLVLGGAGLLYAVRRRRRTVLARSPGSHR